MTGQVQQRWNSTGVLSKKVKELLQEMDLRGPYPAVRSAARQREEEAEAQLPSSEFLHFACHVLMVGRPPEVELRACWPFDVHGSAAWAGVAA
ncbi:hypothetical protein NDU88_006257 [Pleurodeles waltl]|uniref:Uncharacterized protein n=1 Tax=Pleurodeles waltl TaxID=8319 RepID=A0AAV7N2X5_PLEWA|nr:hypothetical protein NDU88_006257 [Pleurodeles waltl]